MHTYVNEARVATIVVAVIATATATVAGRHHQRIKQQHTPVLNSNGEVLRPLRKHSPYPPVFPSGGGTGSYSSRSHSSSNNEGTGASTGARSSAPVILKGTAVPVRSLVARRSTPTPSAPPPAKAKQPRARHIVSVTDNPKLRAAAVAAQQALAARKKSSTKAAKTATAGAVPTSGGAASAGRSRMGEVGRITRLSSGGSSGEVAAVASGASRVWSQENKGAEGGGAGGGGGGTAAKSSVGAPVIAVVTAVIFVVIFVSSGLVFFSRSLG